MKSRIQFLYALLAFLAAEAIQIIFVFGFQMIYGVVLGLKKGLEKASQGFTDPEAIAGEIQNAMSQDILYAISAFAVFLCGIVFFFWYRYEIKKDGMRGTRFLHAGQVLLLCLLGIGCQLFVTGIMSVSRQYFTELFSDYSEQVQRLTGGNIIIVLLLMIIIAPVTEELVFRGVILHKAGKAIPFWGANLLQAMLFGIYHWNIIQGIYAAFIGLILGLVCYKFKTIYASMLLHMIINTSSLPVALLPQNIMSYYLMVITGGIFTIVGLWYVMQKREPEDEF